MWIGAYLSHNPHTSELRESMLSVTQSQPKSQHSTSYDDTLETLLQGTNRESKSSNRGENRQRATTQSIVRHTKKSFKKICAKTTNKSL